MEPNVGGWDRRIRWIVGAGALGAAMLGRRSGWRKAALLLAGTEFVTAGARYCPVNQALGIDTAKPRQRKGIPLPKQIMLRGNISDGVHEVTSDLAYQRHAIVNIVFLGNAGHWVLVDAGVKGAAARILKAAEKRFGPGSKPAAIVLTHGHFDHVGALQELAQVWNVPIYAHGMELPYLDGRSSYPPPDPTVGGGMLARMSGFYPRGPIDVGRWLRPLPSGGHVPGLDGWECIHTPGHTPGHISLWNEAHRILIAGDAVITTRQESAYAVARQLPELNGPPKYYTQDWELAEDSVKRLAELAPETLITGHGPPIAGPEATWALNQLAEQFETLGMPEEGRYVWEPAIADWDGTHHVSKR